MTKDDIIAVAKECFDPEIPVNIWDLGLIYDIAVDETQNTVQVKMTLTSQHCPAAKSLPDDLKTRITSKLAPASVQVDVVFEPVWTPERISEDGKKKLGIEE